jgi:hypothetical protein
MPPETSGDEPPTRIEEVFVGLSIQGESRRADGRVRPTVRELLLYLTDPDFDLSADVLKEVRNNPELARSFSALKGRLQCFVMPVAAAASTETLDERRFEGAAVRLVSPKAMPGQTVVVVVLDDPRHAPGLLLLEGPDGELCRELLPEPDEEGRIQLLKASAVAADARFLALLRDPRSSGVFLGGPS